jgi:D-alanyl-D-alanine carboxypeptidase/D-alanyl-D-alanine-endopeptidase (penicillin-binding protein 4)
LAAAGPIVPTIRRPLRLLLAVLAAALACAAPWTSSGTASTTATPVTTRLARALAVPGVDHAREGAVAVDLRSGEVIFARNLRLALAPASNEKLTLSYALLSTLGPAYRLRTTVVGAGERVGATWHGDLVLKGVGDPTLSTGDLRRLAARVRASGIRRVSGSIVGDESLFDARRTAAGWKASFYRTESAPLSALSVDGGFYRGTVTTDPALTAARVFRDALRGAGVAASGKVRRSGAAGAGTELAATVSRPLALLLRRVNSDSDNFTAELLLKHLGAVDTGRGTTAAGAAVVRRVLAEAGIPLLGARIVDGSGLSRLDRLSADTLVGLLESAWADPAVRAAFVGTLAVAGRRGTLERRLTRAPALGRVWAKTGTTSVASALSGYVAGRYAFALVHNGASLATWRAREAQDRFVGVLARS